MRVVFTCANFKTLHSGWCVAEERGKIGQGYHFVKANSVGPAEDKNYNCIGKKYGDNSACCLDDFIPDPKDLTPLDDNSGATTTPDPKTTVAFTCADAKDQPTGWCVTEVKSRFVHGLYNFAEANAVGPAKNLNYNCIGKPFAENSVCCRSTYKPKPNVLNSFTSQDCQIKKSIGT
ncbi:hypothetical protein PSTT_07778 [Puccinia striiformis]|uniref:Uncharacterized protein n=1 Tax=Puccinia striiformis TaxID=27350 RepID=A0A2S4VEU1_9BASI|nr:hypothetical protein PSTT_07778 [Puccinia striiformis]